MTRLTDWPRRATAAVRQRDSVSRYWFSAILAVAASAVTVMAVVQLVQGTSTSTSASAAQPATPRPLAAPPVPQPPVEPCKGSKDRLAKVSITFQTLWFCEGGRAVQTSPVTTGNAREGEQTPTGSWHILLHETDRHLSGPGYTEFVHFWLPFQGDFGFHDAPWQKMPFGDRQGYKTQGSHGCVHVPEAAMASLYRWAGDGTAVTIEA